MGRTARLRRKKKQTSRPTNLGSDGSFVDLAKWMCQNGWSPTCRLTPADFALTGRGLRTYEDLANGQIIVSIPIRLLITTETVANSDIGWIFKRSPTLTFPAQLVLTTFLLWERKKTTSYWSSYIKTLPCSFTTPSFCTADELTLLPTFLSKQLVIYNDALLNHFLLLSKVAKVDHRCLSGNISTCEYCEADLCDLFNFRDFLWAWFAVNTRSVYYRSTQDSIPISDKDCLALAPYLDMFNHSNVADIDVQQTETNYEIRTRIPFEKHSQVFIRYGSHPNWTLYLEYGFVLPCNEFDAIRLTFEEVLHSAETMDFHSSSAKEAFLRSHELDSDLYINNDGPSFNVLAVASVLTSSAADLTRRSFSQSVFSGHLDGNKRQVVRALIQAKRVEYEQLLETMKVVEECTASFQVARDLMQEYINLLNRAALLVPSC